MKVGWLAAASWAGSNLRFPCLSFREEILRNVRDLRSLVLSLRVFREGMHEGDVRVLPAVAEAPLQLEAVRVLVLVPSLLVDLGEVLCELLLDGAVGLLCGIVVCTRNVYQGCLF